MTNRSNNMMVNVQTAPSEWTALEHYRLHTVETWPDSPYKDATLAAIRSSLAGLSRDATPIQAPEWRSSISVSPRLAA